MTQEINLSNIFGEVAKVLAANQQDLDNADEANHDHGSNMVNTFNLLTEAVGRVKDQPVSDQLAYASNALREQSKSGSAQLYANGLQQASREFIGKDLNASTAGTLINAMMSTGETTERGGGDFLSSLLGNLSKPKEEEQPAPTQPNDLLSSLIGSLGSQQTQTQAPSQANDLLGSLLGGLTGTQQTAPKPASQLGSDLLGSLLGGLGAQQQAPQSSSGGIGDILSTLLGGQSASSQDQTSGLDIKDLHSVGLAYYSAKQSGQSDIQAIMQALASSSPFGKSRDRQQSGALVVNTILSMLGSR